MEYTYGKASILEREPAKSSVERFAKPLVGEIGKKALEIAMCSDREVDEKVPLETQAYIDSFTAFYKEIYKGLLFFASKKLNDIYTAEDAVSETMIVLFNKWSELKTWLDETDGKGRLRGYAYGTIKNIIFSIYRDKQRQVIVPEPIDTDAQAMGSPESYIAHWDVESSISELPLQQERVIRMTMIGATNEEIAQILGITQSSVRTHLANARRSLKPQYGRDSFLDI